MLKRDNPAATIAVLLIEESGDYYHKPEAIVITDTDDHTVVYCQDARYNFIQAALHKHAIGAIAQKGVLFRNQHLEAKQIDLGEFQLESPFGVTTREEIIRTLFRRNPRQFWFLEKYIDGKS